MAADNGIFYIDLIDGSDSSLSDITGVNLINNGSGRVIGSKTSHGLVNGQCFSVPTGTYAGKYFASIINLDSFYLIKQWIVYTIYMLHDYVADGDFIIIGTETYTFKTTPIGSFDVKLEKEMTLYNLYKKINEVSSIMYANYSRGNQLLLFPNNPETHYSSSVSIAFTELENIVSITQSPADSAIYLAYSAARNGVAITPYRGYSFDNPLKTIAAAGTASGSIYINFKIAKTPDPVSLGYSASVTSGNSKIPIPSGSVKAITLGSEPITSWVASVNVSKATSQGKGFLSVAQIQIQSAFTTGKICYLPLSSTLDLSAFTKLCFWFYNSVATAAFKLNLCSDATGDVPVNIIDLPFGSSYVAISAASIDVANLGSNINSISISADVDPGANTVVFIIENIIATNAHSFMKLYKLGETGCPYAAQSFDDSYMYIDSGKSNGNNSSRTACITEEDGAYSVYAVPAIEYKEIASSSTYVLSSTFKGFYSFGWNKSTNIQDSITAFIGSNANGYFLGSSGFSINHISRLVATRFCHALISSNEIPAIIESYFSSQYVATFNFTGGTPSGFAAIKSYFYNLSSIFYNLPSAIAALWYFSSTFSNVTAIASNGGFFAFNCSFIHNTKFLTSSFANYLIECYNCLFFNKSFPNTACQAMFYNCRFENLSRPTTTEYPTHSQGTVLYIQCTLLNYKVESTLPAQVFFRECTESGLQYFSTGEKFNSFRNHNGYGNNFSAFGMISDNTTIYNSKWQTEVKHDEDIGAWAFYQRGSGGISINYLVANKFFVPAMQTSRKIKIAEVLVRAGVDNTFSTWLYINSSTSPTGFLALNVEENELVGIPHSTAYANKTLTRSWQKVSVMVHPIYDQVIEVFVLNMISHSEFNDNSNSKIPAFYLGSREFYHE